MSYQAVIGLEVHLQLATNSKLFSACPANYHGSQANSHTDPYSLGLPGALPTLNRQALELALMFGLALGCEVEGSTEFHRKNYFYPDSPKNFQLSQYDKPVARNGALSTSHGIVRIKRAHLEDDAGKLSHPSYAAHSLLDINRSGSALIEMVTEADIVSGEQAREFLEQIQAIARTLGVSEANPEEGKMRCDVNISLHQAGQPWGTKVEVKNLNSFRSVARAIAYETQRQERLLSNGQKINQDTLGWDDGGQKTFLMRSKEGEADYRYFPEPDLPPLLITAAMLENLRQGMPELPAEKKQRYLTIDLKEADAHTISYNIDLAEFFDKAIINNESLAQKIANWLLSDIAGLLGDKSIQDSQLEPRQLSELVQMIEEGKISSRTAKDLLPELLKGQDAKSLVKERKLEIVSDTTVIDEAISQAIANDPAAAEQVQAGNKKALNALFGPIMRQLNGKADPKVVRQRLANKLSN